MQRMFQSSIFVGGMSNHAFIFRELNWYFTFIRKYRLGNEIGFYES